MTLLPVFLTNCSHLSTTYPARSLAVSIAIVPTLFNSRESLTAFSIASFWSSPCLSFLLVYIFFILYNFLPHVSLSSLLSVFCPYKIMICSTHVLCAYVYLLFLRCPCPTKNGQIQEVWRPTPPSSKRSVKIRRKRSSLLALRNGTGHILKQGTPAECLLKQISQEGV